MFITTWPQHSQAKRRRSAPPSNSLKRTGHSPEVFVRHEDDRFITGWVCGEDLHPDEAARPAGKNSPAAVALKVNALRCQNQSDRALL
jgi:hypothetical protein